MKSRSKEKARARAAIRPATKPAARWEPDRRRKPKRPPDLKLSRDERMMVISNRLMNQYGPPRTVLDVCVINARLSVGVDGAPEDYRDILDRALRVSQQAFMALGNFDEHMRLHIIDVVEGAFYEITGRSMAAN